MAYTHAQRKVLNQIRREALRRYAPGGFTRAERKKIRSAFQTGRIESGFRNLHYGDADSQGWRQERAQFYPNPTNLPASVKRYFNEADRAYSGQTPAQLSQAVQRSAFPGRYATARGEAIKLTKRLVKGKSPVGIASGPQRRSVTKLKRIPGVDRSAERRALLMGYLENRDDPNALLDVAKGLRETTDTPARLKAVKKQVQVKGLDEGGPKVQQVRTLIERASRMNAKHMPYVWGGGHGNPKALGPWDCSGAISRLFRINPRVSGQFESWGKPGKGKHVTVYANSGHVFAEINGRFFGTSRSNPGGGAGWIPASQMSPSYLAQFTKRHPEGL